MSDTSIYTIKPKKARKPRSSASSDTIAKRKATWEKKKAEGYSIDKEVIEKRSATRTSNTLKKNGSIYEQYLNKPVETFSRNPEKIMRLVSDALHHDYPEWSSRRLFNKINRKIADIYALKGFSGNEIDPLAYHKLFDDAVSRIRYYLSINPTPSNHETNEKKKVNEEDAYKKAANSIKMTKVETMKPQEELAQDNVEEDEECDYVKTKEIIHLENKLNTLLSSNTKPYNRVVQDKVWKLTDKLDALVELEKAKQSFSECI